MPAEEASQLLSTLRTSVEDVAATGANQSHDLTGRIFQKLIADRKYLATFYTLPASAALLARLAVSKMDVDWSDAEAIGSLKIGDFACGTGALLSAVYEQIMVSAVCSAVLLSTPAPPEPLPHLYASANQLRAINQGAGRQLTGVGLPNR